MLGKWYLLGIDGGGKTMQTWAICIKATHHSFHITCSHAWTSFFQKKKKRLQCIEKQGETRKRMHKAQQSMDISGEKTGFEAKLEKTIHVKAIMLFRDNLLLG